MSFACLLQQLFCEINSITENQKLDAAIAKKKSKKSCATSYLKDTKKNILSNFMLSKNGYEKNLTNSSGFYQFKKWEKEISCYLSGGRKDKFISGMTMRMSMSENHICLLQPVVSPNISLKSIALTISAYENEFIIISSISLKQESLP